MCKQNIVACELRIKGCVRCVLESCFSFDGSFPQTVNIVSEVDEHSPTKFLQ